MPRPPKRFLCGQLAGTFELLDLDAVERLERALSAPTIAKALLLAGYSPDETVDILEELELDADSPVDLEEATAEGGWAEQLAIDVYWAAAQFVAKLRNGPLGKEIDKLVSMDTGLDYFAATLRSAEDVRAIETLLNNRLGERVEIVVDQERFERARLC